MNVVVECPHEDCVDAFSEKCQSCLHNKKRSYYQPKYEPYFPYSPWYPNYPYYPVFPVTYQQMESK